MHVGYKHPRVGNGVKCGSFSRFRVCSAYGYVRQLARHAVMQKGFFAARPVLTFSGHLEAISMRMGRMDGTPRGPCLNSAAPPAQCAGLPESVEK